MAKKTKAFDHRFFDVVTVGERGQIVIPSNARKALGIKAGQKLVALEGPMGSSIVFIKMESMNGLLNKISNTVGEMKFPSE